MTKRNILILTFTLVILGVAGRVLPHAWNATPVVAIALFAGTYLGRRYAIALPLVVMILSDFFIGFYDPAVMVAVYGTFVAIGLIGYAIKKIKTAPVVLLVSMCSSILFFLVTNWAVWVATPMYEKTFNGLLTSYAMALPFFRNMFFGDLLFTILLFGAYELLVLGSFRFKRNKILSLNIKY